MKIDVGCGYRGDIHHPNLHYDIFLEPFLNHSNDAWIGLLKSKGHPVMASAQDLPFRSNVFTELQCRAVMEHLPKPFKALSDFKYCSKEGGMIEVTVPIITNHFKHYLMQLFIAFPFGVYDVLICMNRMMKHYHDDGLAHVSDVKAKDIIPFFDRHELEYSYYRHKWFYGVWGKIIKKYLTRGTEPIHDVQGALTVRVWK